MPPRAAVAAPAAPSGRPGRGLGRRRDGRGPLHRDPRLGGADGAHRPGLLRPWWPRAVMPCWGSGSSRSLQRSSQPRPGCSTGWARRGSTGGRTRRGRALLERAYEGFESAGTRRHAPRLGWHRRELQLRVGQLQGGRRLRRSRIQGRAARRPQRRWRAPVVARLLSAGMALQVAATRPPRDPAPGGAGRDHLRPARPGGGPGPGAYPTTDRPALRRGLRRGPVPAGPGDGGAGLQPVAADRAHALRAISRRLRLADRALPS